MEVIHTQKVMQQNSANLHHLHDCFCLKLLIT
jgi:hypothetical protein